MRNMSTVKPVGKVQTVLGLIDAGELGTTLTHEHCLFDNSVLLLKPAKNREMRFIRL